jgi:hypothetical protein
MNYSKHWTQAVEYDIKGTILLEQNRRRFFNRQPKDGIERTTLFEQELYPLAYNFFESAFDEYDKAWKQGQSPQILFDYAGFCWCLSEPGLTMSMRPYVDGSLFSRINYVELIDSGLKKFSNNKRILFLKKYIDSRFCGNVTEEDILQTVDTSNPRDIPYFLLFLLSDKKRYNDNVKLLWLECTKKLTLFNQLIITLLEYDCDPNLFEVR